MTSVATEAWIGCALLQRKNPEGAFTSKQIKEKVALEIQQGRLNGPLRPGVYVHASVHNIANKKANSVRLRFLTKTNNGLRRLYRHGDPVHPTRENAPTINEKGDIPRHYQDLMDWYQNVFLHNENIVEAAPVDDIHVLTKPTIRQRQLIQQGRRNGTQNRAIEDRLRGLIENFDRYLNHFVKNIKFSGPSVYFHKKVIQKIRKTEQYEKLFSDDIYFDYLYATIVSWGMNTMGKNGPKMTEFDTFKQSILNNKKNLIKLSKLRLEKVELSEIKEVLKIIFDSLKIMKSDSKLVGNSKVLHHLLPDLIVPIDRTHTLRFFFNNSNINTLEADLFLELFDHFQRISKAIKFENYELNGFNTSIPKIIDNAIMGYAMKKLL